MSRVHKTLQLWIGKDKDNRNEDGSKIHSVDQEVIEAMLSAGWISGLEELSKVPVLAHAAGNTAIADLIKTYMSHQGWEYHGFTVSQENLLTAEFSRFSAIPEYPERPTLPDD